MVSMTSSCWQIIRIAGVPASPSQHFAAVGVDDFGGIFAEVGARGGSDDVTAVGACDFGGVFAAVDARDCNDDFAAVGAGDFGCVFAAIGACDCGVGFGATSIPCSLAPVLLAN